MEVKRLNLDRRKGNEPFLPIFLEKDADERVVLRPSVIRPSAVRRPAVVRLLLAAVSKTPMYAVQRGGVRRQAALQGPRERPDSCIWLF